MKNAELEVEMLEEDLDWDQELVENNSKRSGNIMSKHNSDVIDDECHANAYESGAAGVDVGKVGVKANNNQESIVKVDESNPSTVEGVNPVADLCNI